jgi:short-subunit dehydrogenase
MNIVITGASKGIGKAIAKKFASDNHNHTIFICARNESELKSTCIEIKDEYNVEILYRPTDMSRKEDVNAFANWILEKTKSIDVIVNNAGSYLPGAVHNEKEGTLEKMIELNLYSAYHLTRALVPSMIKNKSGHIFNMCSIASLHAYANGGSYSISKFALMGFSKNLREELKEHNIKVTAVYPGAVYTDSWAGSGVSEERIMEANDIAELIYTTSKLSPQACVEDIIVRPQLGDL